MEQDPKNENWWMKYGGDVLGYWPSSMFTHLADSATMINWGGEVVNSETNEGHTTTQMGSGHFPGGRYGKASYFRNIQVVDSSNKFIDPEWVGTVATVPGCYDVKNGISRDWGNYFYFGGPGKSPNCP